MEKFTKHIIEDMKDLREKGFSYSEIALYLNENHGSSFTRSAIAGKFFRLARK